MYPIYYYKMFQFQNGMTWNKIFSLEPSFPQKIDFKLKMRKNYLGTRVLDKFFNLISSETKRLASNFILHFSQE